MKLEDYFRAAQAFLLENHRECLLEALACSNGTQVRAKDIESIRIRSEKQGLLYHVASVDIEGKGLSRKFSFISAVTQTGRKALEREFQTLTRLNQKCSVGELPEVYCKGTVKVPAGGRKEDISFLLGEWFEGYHEWHLSREKTGHPCLRIWDLQDGHRAATDKEFKEIFRQASQILTRLYDPETSSQVRQWHHAAGDFVVGQRKGAPHVRLTTIREYGPLLGAAGADLEDPLAHLLFFFLDMTVRMRLDKWDGVGDPVWVKSDVTQSVLQGFLEALSMKGAEDRSRQVSSGEFLDLLRSFSRQELLAAFGPLMELYRRGDTGDLMLIERKLESHVSELDAAINKLPLSGPWSAS